MDWNDVRHFLALARLRSVRAAGAALGVSHSTVARRVEALEVQLSTRLFDRNRDGYMLTDAGRRMLPRAEAIEREVSAMERALVGQDDRLAGAVSLTCCDAFVSAMLITDLTDFFSSHPEVELHLTVDARFFDLSKREADIAVRVLGPGTQPPGHLIGQRLVPLHIASYVGVAHAERLVPGRPGTRWLAFEEPKIMDWLVGGSSYPEVPQWGAFTSMHTMIQGLQSGLGIGMLPCYVGDLEPTLQRLPQPDVRHVADIWLLSHPDLRDNVRIRAVRGRVRSAILARVAQFSGG